MPNVDANAAQPQVSPKEALGKVPNHAEPPGDRPAKSSRRVVVSPQRRLAWGVIQGLAFLYVSLLLIMIVMETRLVYPAAFSDPTRIAADRVATIVPGGSSGATIPQQPNDPAIVTVQYPTSDGLKLPGRLLHRGSGKEIVLFFHGNGSKAAWLDTWLHRLSEHFDANVMAAEYRGYEDDVTPTEQGVLQDCLAARDFLCQRYQVAPGDLIIFGRSLGGGCAVAVAANGGAKALILDRTFDRLVDVAANKYPIFPVRWVMRNRYDSVAKLTIYHGPLIMVHGDVDELVAMERGRRLYDSAVCEPKRWIQVDGLGHMVPLSDQTLSEVAETLRNFTQKESGDDQPTLPLEPT